jgi:hypothetical protein
MHCCFRRSYTGTVRVLLVVTVVLPLILLSQQICSAAAAVSGASASPSSPAVDKLLSLAARLRGLDEIKLAEIVDDQAWNLQVKESPALTADDQDKLIAYLWKQVSSSYLTTENVWLWNGTAGPKPQLIIKSLDARYVADKAEILVNGILRNNYTTALLTNSKASTFADSQIIIPYNDVSALRARMWLNTFASSIGANINGDYPNPTDQKNAELQPWPAIIYVAASKPLAGSDLSIAAAPKNTAGQPCLLNPDQIETLVRAMLNQSVFTGTSDTQTAKSAASLITFLKKTYPNYPRMDRIDGISQALTPLLPSK